MQRVKDPDKFRFDLNKPLPGQKVTEEEVGREMDDFAAFAAAMGASPT